MSSPLVTSHGNEINELVQGSKLVWSYHRMMVSVLPVILTDGILQALRLGQNCASRGAKI